MTVEGVVKSGACSKARSSSSMRRMCGTAGLRGTSGLGGDCATAGGGGEMEVM